MFHRSTQIVTGLIGMAALLAIIQYFPQPRYSQFWDSFFDTGHVFVFGFFVLFVLRVAATSWGERGLFFQYLGSIVGSLIVGCAVELWQRSHDRSAEWIDVFSDLVGILAFAALHAGCDARIPLPRIWLLRRRTLWTIALGLVMLGLVPLSGVCWQYYVRRSILPQLIDFSRPWNQFFHYTNNGQFSAVSPPPSWPRSETAETLGRFDLTPGVYPSFVLREPHPDWSGHGYLEIEILLDERKSRDFVLRIHDYQHNNDPHDRFRRRVTLVPGFQTLRVALADVRAAPRNRELNMHEIEAMVLYTVQLESPLTIYLGQIRLVNEG